jgi:hypothetical protein
MSIADLTLLPAQPPTPKIKWIVTEEIGVGAVMIPGRPAPVPEKIEYKLICPSYQCGGTLEYKGHRTTLMAHFDFDHNRKTEHFHCPLCGRDFTRKYQWEEGRK